MLLGGLLLDLLIAFLAPEYLKQFAEFQFGPRWQSVGLGIVAAEFVQN